MSTTEKKNNNSMMHLSHSEKGGDGKIGKKKNEISMRSELVLKKREPRKKNGKTIYIVLGRGE